ncbi:GNAT family N-acetyltransferase [Streptomyces sp. FB2]|uniref:GNAT family N-acetyltransferase n=1 Tax=Streptomyces sp. FB2 TaxID=2902454 RepID=UPI001F1E9ABB|nr:GNAT family N-acetyltransferase [Streptomyces sp. FB2]MCF2535366.1 GNAT family N-acetyltransferase [Streptomyces sp. FB2]
MTDAAIRPAPRPLPDLHGHGLRLRPWDPDSEADLDAWCRGRADPEFRRWNTPLSLATDREGALASLRTAVGATDGSAAYCVTDAGTGALLGHVGVTVVSRRMDYGLVGYWVLPEARGRRVAVRALDLAARWALTAPDGPRLHRLELGHAVGHDASCRVAERCGFLAEGTLRGAMWEAGRQDAYRDVHLHARLATDPGPDVLITPTPVSV